MGFPRKINLAAEVVGMLPSSQVSGGGQVPYVVDTGAANAYVVTLSPAPSGYTPGLAFVMQIANSNSGASTVNVSGLGNIGIKTNAGAALSGGELPANGLVELQFQGTYFIIATQAITSTPSTAALGTGTANSSTFLRGDRTWAAPVAAAPPEAILGNLQATNVGGGTFNNGSWVQSPLVSISDPSNIAPVTANTFIPVSGIYEAEFDLDGYQVQAFQARLRNVTAASTVGSGDIPYSVTSAGIVLARSRGKCRFTANGTDVYQLEGQCEVTGTFGFARNFGESIPYSLVHLRKIG